MENSPKGKVDLRAASSSGLLSSGLQEACLFDLRKILQVQQENLQVKKKEIISSVNGEVGAGRMGRQCMGHLETKGSKALYNVGESFMALFMS